MKVYKIKVNGKSYRVELEAMDEVASENKPAAEAAPEAKQEAPKPAPSVAGEGNPVLSPIQGTVTKILIKVGDKVKKGQPIVVVEAMKLENEVVSSFDGEVTEILVTKGQSIASKERIALIK